MIEERTGAKYLGGGDYIPGVPARDLTPAEALAHRAEIDANTAAMGRPMYAFSGETMPVVGDDLTEIVGIGERTAEDLRGMGIDTFAKLANMTAVELSSGLNGTSKAQSAKFIQQAIQRLERE